MKKYLHLKLLLIALLFKVIAVENAISCHCDGSDGTITITQTATQVLVNGAISTNSCCGVNDNTLVAEV